MKYLFMVSFVFLYAGAIAQEPQPISGVNMKKNSRWLYQNNGKTIIEVTWENASPFNEQERNWVRTAIETSWEKYANIDFTNWGPSNYSSTGIRIGIDPYGWPHTKGLGNSLDGKTNGMVLTFDFLGQFTRPYGISREDAIKFIAVHEFGHALGFAHEHNRADCLCNEAPQGGDGDFYVTPCDPFSVMNYCNPRWSNYGKLSANDILGVQVIYGKPQIVTAGVSLDEIRLIPCSGNATDRVRNIRSLLSTSPSFAVGMYSEETKAVPQKVADKIPGQITIRFFDLNDEVNALGIKKLLVGQRYPKDSIVLEDMSTKMAAKSRYIEIWARQATVNPATLAIDEIRFIPCTSTARAAVKTMQDAINTASITVKAFSQESNLVPARAISKLPNLITIRFFDPNDEVKAIALKNLLVQKGMDRNLVTVENMMSIVNKLYPGYMEVWMK